MEVVTAIIGPVVQSLMVPVKEHVGYVISSTSYVSEMETKMKELDDKRVDVEKRMEGNKESDLEIPTRVPHWLEEVEKIKVDVKNLSTNGRRCFNVRMRYKEGRKAVKITQKIKSLIEEKIETDWTDRQNPLGKVSSKRASTSTPLGGDTQNDFTSRDQTFKEALRFLQPDNKTQIISLCGMGGVGKTTMMEQLKKVVENRSTFDWVFKVVVGQQSGPIVVQQAIADYMSHPLTESTQTTRADRLHKRFENMSKAQKKVLVILDDVWKMIDLKDIGLSPLPNGFKVLFTSRFEDVCTKMAIEVNSVFEVIRVDVLKEPEAHVFFRQIAGISEESDPDLIKIGGDIVKKCGLLPLAIKLIAATLKFKEKFVWRDALRRLNNKILDEPVQKIIEISYYYLNEEEAKKIFLLCALFPEDFDIPVEELTRYAWGLKLLNEVPTFGNARDRTRTCVHYLQNINLLIASDRPGCVKMHDLVLTFVLSVVSKGDHAWIINHGGMSNWSISEILEPCKSISLTCKGIFEMPEDLKYPNLSLLKLMHGDKSLKFPKDFFGRMENLKVIAYENMNYPLLPISLQCSTNLRTLYLHRCLLMHDISHIGNLLNLEVLSFAYCSIRKLPSPIGNLKRLKLLDLTGSINLCIDDGVLQKLVRLEELYMSVADKKAINFTEANCNELADCSKNLSAIEIEFFESMAQPKNMFLKKIERFMISMGCYLNENKNKFVHSFENTLILDTSKGELFESGINELFDKVEVLHLEVEGMNNLEDVLVKSMNPSQHSLFCNLKVFDVLKCADLRYLFTPRIARGLPKLEHLTISSCQNMKVLIHNDNTEIGVIKFLELKFLSLRGLPNLVSLCNTANVIELPQLVELRLDDLSNFTRIYPENKLATSSMSSDISTIRPFLNKEVVIPKLEKLQIARMENLKEIWPCQFNGREEVNICRLREIRIEGCDSMMNLFPCNPMPWLYHLEKLHVKCCGSIEIIFNLDLGSVYEIEEDDNSSLRHIVLEELGELREVWKMKGVNDSHHIIHAFQDVRTIHIKMCKHFRNVFTPTTANFDLRAIEDIYINGSKHLGDDGRNNELVKSSTSINTNTHGQQDMTMMSHVWKCNWNKFLISQQWESEFCNLTYISLERCAGIKYLFSPHMAKLLSNLKKIEINRCDDIEEVVSRRDDEEMTTSTSTNTNTSFFPHLDTLTLWHLSRLKHIGGGNNAITSNITNTTTIHDKFQNAQLPPTSWSLCQYSTKIHIEECNALSSLVPSHAVGQLQKLEHMSIWRCESMMEIFETQGNSNDGGNSNNAGEGSGGTSIVLTIPRTKNKTLVQLSNLKQLQIVRCPRLGYIFTFSTLESLKQLKELEIWDCKEMQVIVKEEEGEQTTTSKVVVFPRLQTIALVNLPNLKGFFMGMNDFQWPSLEKVEIDGCPGLTVFTSGHSTAPKLNYIETELGKHRLEYGGLNFHGSTTTTTTTWQETQFPTSDSSSSCLASQPIPTSFSNLVQVDATSNQNLRNIIPYDELLQVQKLEKIYARYCIKLVEVFETFKGANNGSNESQSAVKFPELREINLDFCRNLEYIWRNDRLTTLEFPNLTSLSIDYCKLLGHVFTCSMVDSLSKLQELTIHRCEIMEVIVKEETKEEENRAREVVFPCLKSLELEKLPNLKGFCLGKEAFLWPSLHTLKIIKCPEITVFTDGLSTTPKLKGVDTTFGSFYVDEDINSFINTRKQEGYQF